MDKNTFVKVRDILLDAENISSDEMEDVLDILIDNVFNCVECASCQELLEFNTEDISNSTCNKCGGEAK